MPEAYETAGVLATAAHLNGSVFHTLLCSPTVYVLTLVNVGTMASVKYGYFDPEESHLQIHPHHSAMLTGLLSFFLVFYNSKVFARYEKLQALMKDVSESTIVLVAMVKRHVQSKDACQHLLRLLLAGNFIFYFEISPDMTPGAVGNVSQEEWVTLLNLKLLSATEIMSLQGHVTECHATPGHASFILLHWSMLLLMQNHVDSGRLTQFEQRFHVLRDHQADVLALLELSMPFAYVHLLSFMLVVTMLLLAFSFGTADSYVSVMIYFIVQLVFFGVRELSVSLSDPFGVDKVDFPAAMWMTSVYNRCNAIMNDVWDPNDRPAAGFGTLRKIELGRTVFDLQMDALDNGDRPHRTSSYNQKATNDIQNPNRIASQLDAAGNPAECKYSHCQLKNLSEHEKDCQT